MFSEIYINIYKIHCLISSVVIFRCGGWYIKTCMHGSLLLSALRETGHWVSCSAVLHLIPLRWVVPLNLELDPWPGNSRDPSVSSPVCSGSRSTEPSPGLYVGTKDLNPSPHSNPANIPHQTISTHGVLISSSLLIFSAYVPLWGLCLFGAEIPPDFCWFGHFLGTREDREWYLQSVYVNIVILILWL